MGASSVHTGVPPVPLALVKTQLSEDVQPTTTPQPNCPPKSMTRLLLWSYCIANAMRGLGGPPVGASCVQVEVLPALPSAFASTQVSLAAGVQPNKHPPKMIMLLVDVS